MTTPLARALSIFGHPMLVLPLAVLAVALGQGERQAALQAAIGFGLFAALVMAFSWWQVRRGRWAHVDASAQHERSSLNRFLLVALAVSALLVGASGTQPLLALGLALSAAMILVAMVMARWCNVSLHLAFAAAVAWSRLALQRHTPLDLIAGAIIGALAGVAFWPLARHWTG